jgi:molybdenum cofactor cytidylyltransferase
MISVIILGAGRSKRMGQIKQIMPFGGSTILASTIDNYLNSGAAEVIVVLGSNASAIRKAIIKKPVTIVINPDYLMGIGTSIVAGLKNIAQNSSAIMIALGDQPLIDSKIIDLIIQEYKRRKPGIAIPVYNGKRGHPIIFSRSYMVELLTLTEDVGAKEIIQRHPGDVLEISVNSNAVCIDIDTPENYRSALKKLGK